MTCRHVHDAVDKVADQIAYLRAGRSVLRLAGWTSIGLQSALVDVRHDLGDDTDISFCKLPEFYWTLLTEQAGRASIDLDSYQPPTWRAVRFCLAAGFPTGHKSTVGNNVAAPMIEVIAEVASDLSDQRQRFVLHSQLDERNRFGFSGMSGGPIFALDDEGDPTPLGIVYRGHPSGAAHSAEDTSARFLDENDVLIRGLLLTPTTFNSWLVKASV